MVRLGVATTYLVVPAPNLTVPIDGIRGTNAVIHLTMVFDYLERHPELLLVAFASLSAPAPRKLRSLNATTIALTSVCIVKFHVSSYYD